MARRTGLMRATALAALFAAGTLLATSLPGPATADETLKIEVWNKQDGSQGMTLSAAEIKAGKVMFEVTNSSTDMEHEFLYVKTDLAPDQFPMQDGDIKVDEGKLTGFHEFGDVEPGDTKTWTADLDAGKYLLFCNEEGHFKAGMYATLTVTP
jgi:uncharacterized cupredoxin-like copper-binding protein